MYGDLLGSLLKLLSEDVSVEFSVVAMEWEDFDPRLGLRSFAGWSTANHDDILDSVRAKVALFSDCLDRLTAKTNVVISLPSTPFLPLHYSARRRSSCWEGSLKREISLLPEHLLPLKNFRLLNHELLSSNSAYVSRYSAESHLAYGFPYSLDYAEVLARELALLALSPQPLKGVVVDLDETLWKGILGEDGIAGVSWDLDHNSHIHGVFQSFLQSLSGAGVLVAVASKNDPSLVEELFSKRNMLLRRDSIFPLFAGWGRKSASIRKILEAWNIGADAIVFVDDSALEVEEVRTELPEVRSFLFPSGKPDAVLDLISTLRDLFGKDSITAEDSIRLRSLMQREEIAIVSASGGDGYEELLRCNQPDVTLRLVPCEGDSRAFELLNKTNQFNMNGVRCTETEWRALCERKNGFVVVASYEDRFGPLGKIAVIAGFLDGARATLSHWVMSCRAFGRRIEHLMLGYLFEKYLITDICLEYAPTERNAPFRDFAMEFGAVMKEEGMVIDRVSFSSRCPALYHDIRETFE
jgi:FkbH-like protein